MSSSSTETMIDVTMPQMGVSVAEGTVVEWKKQVGDWVEADEIIASISTDKIDTDVESPATGRVAEIIVDVGETVDVGTVMAQIATDAKPGEAHVSENGVPETGTGEATAALEAPGEAGELSGDTTDEHAGTAQPRPRRDGARRYSPVVMRIAAEHDVDLEQVEGTGRGGRVRKQDVLAFIESGAEGRAADAHRVPVPARRAGRGAQAAPAAAARRGGAEGRAAGRPQPLSRRASRRPAALAHAPGDRLADGAVAADRGDLHDDRRGRHEPDRGRAQGGRAQLPALPGARDDRDPARVPGAQRHARGRPAHGLHRRRAPRDRGLARRGRADRPGHPRRPGPLGRGPGQAHQGPRAPRPREPAHAGRGQRRHVHDHQPRRRSARSWPRR